MEDLYNIMLTAVIALLAIGMVFSLIRTIAGPRRADRIMGINLIGSLSTTALAVIAVYLGQSWLLDVCLVYCLISFLAVVVLSKIHISNAEEHNKKKDEDYE